MTKNHQNLKIDIKIELTARSSKVNSRIEEK